MLSDNVVQAESVTHLCSNWRGKQSLTTAVVKQGTATALLHSPNSHWGSMLFLPQYCVGMSLANATARRASPNACGPAQQKHANIPIVMQ